MQGINFHLVLRLDNLRRKKIALHYMRHMITRLFSDYLNTLKLLFVLPGFSVDDVS